MSKYAMLSVDLNRVTTTEQRRKFNEGLAGKQWNKIEALTTLWWASWKDSLSDEQVVSATMAELGVIAKAAGVLAYDASVAVCTGQPTVWKG